MKTSQLILILFMELSLCAQQSSTLTLHFKSRSAALDPAEKQKLRELISITDASHLRYKVSIEGHTDNEGSLEYNERLSSDRAETVKAYFLLAGFDKENIHADFFAFNRPVAVNDGPDGKQQNRRVRIVLEPLVLSVAGILGLPPATESYTVTTNRMSDLKYRSGTMVHIPSQAFVYPDGRPVYGTVQIEYTEYRNAGDFIGSSIPMNWPDHNNDMLQFNSAGMFKIEAFKNGCALKLAENKNIDLNFYRTGDLDNLNLYRFDQTSTRWSLANRTSWFAPAVPATRKIKPFDWGDTRVTRLRGRDSCVINSENAVSMAINTGLSLSSEKDPVYYKRASLYYSRNKIKASFPAKRIIVTGRQKNQVSFIVLFEENNSQNGLQHFEFIYEGQNKRPFETQWENASWTEITMTWLKDDEFWLFLTRNNQKIRLRLRGLYKGQPLCGQEFPSLVSQNKIPNLRIYDECLDKKTKKKSQSSSAAIRNYMKCSDSLYCFYDWSRMWMDNETGESRMDYKTWLDYFNSNKELMKVRYTALKRNEPLIIEQIRLYGSLRRAKDSIDFLAELAGMELRDNLETSISINGLGIWNCDQLNRIEAPMIVKKSYMNTSGENVEPVCVYVIDKTINGVLTYNGFYDMNPHNFKVNSKGKNMLLAYDGHQRVYVCNENWFETAVKNDSPLLVEAIAKEDVSRIIDQYYRE